MSRCRSVEVSKCRCRSAATAFCCSVFSLSRCRSAATTFCILEGLNVLWLDILHRAYLQPLHILSKIKRQLAEGSVCFSPQENNNPIVSAAEGLRHRSGVSQWKGANMSACSIATRGETGEHTNNSNLLCCFVIIPLLFSPPAAVRTSPVRHRLQSPILYLQSPNPQDFNPQPILPSGFLFSLLFLFSGGALLLVCVYSAFISVYFPFTFRLLSFFALNVFF